MDLKWQKLQTINNNKLFNNRNCTKLVKASKLSQWKWKVSLFSQLMCIDATTGEVLWQCDDWNAKEGEEKKVVLPKKIL